MQEPRGSLCSLTWTLPLLQRRAPRPHPPSRTLPDRWCPYGRASVMPRPEAPDIAAHAGTRLYQRHRPARGLSHPRPRLPLLPCHEKRSPRQRIPLYAPPSCCPRHLQRAGRPDRPILAALSLVPKTCSAIQSVVARCTLTTYDRVCSRPAQPPARR